MIDGRLLQALPVRTGTNRRDDTPHSVRAKPLASAVALLRTGTDADVVFSVVLDDGLVLCLDRRLSVRACRQMLLLSRISIAAMLCHAAGLSLLARRPSRCQTMWALHIHSRALS
jgi:hypothetical protein